MAFSLEQDVKALSETVKHQAVLVDALTTSMEAQRHENKTLEDQVAVLQEQYGRLNDQVNGKKPLYVVQDES